MPTRRPSVILALIFLWPALPTRVLAAAEVTGARDFAASPAAARHWISAEPAWDMLQAKPEVVEAWKDMRFGMFVCWGPVSLTGLEIGWSRGKAWPHQQQGGGGPTPVEVYDNLYKAWKPDKFDAREWVKVAQDMGARYMIFLVKHHDGFCLYDTKLTDYKITGPESAWKHDVLKDVADACHEAGLKLILYYSQPDWHHPDYKTENHARYNEYFHGQVRELLTNYGRIDGLWFDLGGSPQDWDTERLFQMARTLQPWLIINNRVGLPGDFDTPENQVGFFQNTPAVGDELHPRPPVELEAERYTVPVRGMRAGARLLRDRGRQFRAEHRPDARRPDRTAAGRTLPGHRQLAAEVRREHLRDARRTVRRSGRTVAAEEGILWPISTGRRPLVGRLDPSGQRRLSAHSPLANGYDYAAGDPATSGETHRPHRWRGHGEADRSRYRSLRARGST